MKPFSQCRFTLQSLLRIWLAAFAALWLIHGAIGCASKGPADISSTDTGNPPVIDAQRINVAASDDGVIVRGEPGAVEPGGASVEVTNVSTGDSVTSSAAKDGSFEVQIAGDVEDEYAIEVDSDAHTDRVTVGGSRADPGGSPSPSGSDIDLDGREYILESAEGYVPASDVVFQISFEDGGFGFHAGCNGHGATYTVCDGHLCLEDAYTSTLIGCSGELGDQEAFAEQFFLSEPALTQQGPRLTMTTDDVTLVFVEKGAEPADPSDPQTGLFGRDFDWVGGEGFEPIPGSRVQLQFSDIGELSVSGGCNWLLFECRICGDELCCDDQGSTARGCSVELMDQDVWVGDFFSSRPTVDVNGDALTLTGSEATLVFSASMTLDASLTDDTWLVSDYFTADGSTTSGAFNGPTVTFDSGGTFGFQTGCNNGGGKYVAVGTTLTFSNVGWEEMGCPDEVNAALEAQMLGVLADGVSTYEIDGTRLVISRDDAGIGAILQ